MAQRITVNDLIADVRQQLDEDSTLTVSDKADILPALNRAQNYALDILVRQYKDPLLTHTTITAVSGQSEYDIPEDAFEQRLLKVEVQIGGSFNELLRVDYQDVGRYESTLSTSTPYYYTVVGNQFKVLPPSNGVNNFRIWYLRDPLPLVPHQGRINIVNAAQNYIFVDVPGEDLTTVSDDLESFVNVVDGASGVRKATLQIQSIQSNKITFKTVPTRTTVLDIDVDTSMTGLGISQDDYICISSGVCVPFMKKPFSNFLVQYAVAEIVRKLGGEAGLEEQVLAKFEKQVEKTWVQRPNSLRVIKRAGAWTHNNRRTITTN